MSRSRTPFLSGTILNNPLAIGGTSLSSAGLASLPAIASPDIAVLVLDPAGSGGVPEVVWVTAHTASATTATITRGAEGTTARAHNLNVPWIHAPTTYDFQETFGAQLTAATNLVLPVSDHEKFFVVTGTTSISTISPRTIGSRIYLQFLSDVTLIWTAATNGLIWPANNGISNNILAKSDEILEFVFTGNRWYLIARSQPSASGWQVVTRNATEQTMTSATPADLVTFSGLNIPATSWIRITGLARKGNVAAQGYVGLKINSTVVCEADNVTRLVRFNTVTAEVENCTFEILIAPRSANYFLGVRSTYAAVGMTDGVFAVGPILMSNSIPIATITSLALRASNSGGVMLVGIKDVVVEILI